MANANHSQMNNEVTLLIDGNNTLHRTHWIANNTGRPLVNSKGVNTGSIFAFIKTVKANATQFNADKIYIAWDKRFDYETPNFRKTLTEGTYKSTRNQERNKSVYDSMDPIVNIVTSLGIRNIYPGKLEADDVISWLSKSIPGKKVIVSVDNDFAQLVSPDVSFFNPIKKVIINVDNFSEHFGLTPKEYVYYKAIAGDKSDNIPGLEGFGKIKGQKLAKAYAAGNPEALQYKEHIDSVLKLVDLNYGLEQFPDEVALYEKQAAELNSVQPDFNNFTAICEELEFKSVVENLVDWKKVFNKQANNKALVDFCKLFS